MKTTCREVGQAARNAELVRLLGACLTRLERAALRLLAEKGRERPVPTPELLVMMEQATGEPIGEQYKSRLSRLVEVGLVIATRGPTGGRQVSEVGKRLLEVLDEVDRTHTTRRRAE